MAYILDLYSEVQGGCPMLYISLLQLYSEGGATLGPSDPIVTAGE